MEGRVYKSTGSWYLVKAGHKFYHCRIKGKMRLQGIKSTNPVAVGDIVKLEVEENGDEAMIVEVNDRKNYIIRKSVNLSKRTHIIAANLDQAILIATLEQPRTHIHFIDRFLVTAEAYNIPATVIFHKTDLYGEKLKDELNYYTIAYGEAGYRVIHTSLYDKNSLKEFKNILKGEVSLLSGNSGVGKSSLVNSVEPTLELKTTQLSETHMQGQHTTTFAEMFDMEQGGQIIDTPGIRGFGLVHMEKEEIGDYFPEIFKLKANCRFHNCLHLEEPGCAVKEALEKSELAPFRYESYLSLVHGLEEDETYRNDIHK